MAKGDMMLQIAVEQLFSSTVQSFPEIWTVAIDFLDGDRTIVREIASEKNQGCGSPSPTSAVPLRSCMRLRMSPRMGWRS